MLARMKVLVGCLKAEAQWKYFVSLADAWGMGSTQFRRGITVRGARALSKAWFDSMPCPSKKLVMLYFMEALIFTSEP
jgi:hypothetical protein